MFTRPGTCRTQPTSVHPLFGWTFGPAARCWTPSFSSMGSGAIPCRGGNPRGNGSVFPLFFRTCAEPNLSTFQSVRKNGYPWVPWFLHHKYQNNPIGSMYGIYANIWGILMGSMLPYIAAPWILWECIFLTEHALLEEVHPGHRTVSRSSSS